ncbi:hypothetical protein EXA21_04120 [Vibrio cincinnatiensis]|uniref:hypothetical protein n=1 Tax=Vibrio cincinnatiensis TaxID=675 RepID=UPI001EE14EA4|nr:hypothetical protein [Vibrio cincinnatiensis]MCG3759951.1 hypothetical protein [Vibrio cincinnatiensis]MCG3762097.1 hypothetical protein [Vibrio cincinnatiensis]
MKHYQQGVATLLITSVLLSVALVVTLGSYKSLFYQIKRAQNEVKARQQYWIAEGGLECVFSLTQVTKSLPEASHYAECNSLGLVTYHYTKPTRNQLNVTAQYGFSRVQKTITYPAAASGVLRATSNLYFSGGLAMLADPGLALDDNQWACTMLRYSQDFLANGTIQNKGLSDTHPPYLGFPSGQSCGSDYVTSTSVNYAMPTALKKDFIQDVDQTPFEDLFGEARQDWFKIMSDSQFSKISASNLVDSSGKMLFTQQSLPPPAVVPDCGSKIKDKIKTGQDLIWIYGSCHLGESDLTDIGQAISSASGLDGVILMVHNGLFSTKGALTFKGMIYHFISNASDGTPEFTPSATLWNSLNTDQAEQLKGTVDHESLPLPNVSVGNTAYFQNGAFYPTGGYVMDDPETYAVFTSAMDFLFNRDAIDIPLSKIRQFKWQQGSWYAQ